MTHHLASKDFCWTLLVLLENEVEEEKMGLEQLVFVFFFFLIVNLTTYSSVY